MAKLSNEGIRVAHLRTQSPLKLSFFAPWSLGVTPSSGVLA